MEHTKRYRCPDLPTDLHRRLGEGDPFRRLAIDLQDLVAGLNSRRLRGCARERRDHGEHLVLNRDLDPYAAEFARQAAFKILQISGIEELAVGIIELFDKTLQRPVQGLLIIDSLRLVEVVLDRLVDLRKRGE